MAWYGEEEATDKREKEEKYKGENMNERIE